MRDEHRLIIGKAAPALRMLLPFLILLVASSSLSAAELDLARIVASEPDEAAPDLWAPGDWVVRVEPMLWAPGLRADFSFAGSSAIVSSENLNIDEPTPSPSAELFIRAGKLIFSFSGFGFFADETHAVDDAFTAGSLSVGAGERINTNVDIASFDAVLQYRIWEEILPNNGNGSGVAFALDIGGGLRVFDVDSTIRAIGGAQVTDDALWVQPIIAITFSADLLDDVSLDIALTGGGFGFDETTSFSAGINAGIRWRFSENVGIQVGFRHLAFELTDGDGADAYELTDASLSGMYGGFSFRF